MQILPVLEAQFFPKFTELFLGVWQLLVGLLQETLYNLRRIRGICIECALPA